MSTYKTYFRDGTQDKDIQTFFGPASMVSYPNNIVFNATYENNETIYRQETVKQEEERMELAKIYENVSNTVHMEIKVLDN